MGYTKTNKIASEEYLKELYSSIDEILTNYNYAIFIEDEDLLKKVFSIVEEIHEKIHLKYFVVTSLKIYLGDSIIINFVKQYESTNFTQIPQEGSNLYRLEMNCGHENDKIQ
jgi:hypothetical protein